MSDEQHFIWAMAVVIVAAIVGATVCEVMR